MFLLPPEFARKIIVIYAKYPDFKNPRAVGLAKLIKEDAGNIQARAKNV